MALFEFFITRNLLRFRRVFNKKFLSSHCDRCTKASTQSAIAEIYDTVIIVIQCDSASTLLKICERRISAKLNNYIKFFC